MWNLGWQDSVADNPYQDRQDRLQTTLPMSSMQPQPAKTSKLPNTFSYPAALPQGYYTLNIFVRSHNVRASHSSSREPQVHSQPGV